LNKLILNLHSSVLEHGFMRSLLAFLHDVDVAAEVLNNDALQGLERKHISGRKTSHSQFERNMRPRHGMQRRLLVAVERADALTSSGVTMAGYD
jgi:hypothetical protein